MQMPGVFALHALPVQNAYQPQLAEYVVQAIVQRWVIVCDVVLELTAKLAQLNARTALQVNTATMLEGVNAPCVLTANQVQ